MIYFLIQTLFILPSWGLSPKTVKAWPECQGKKSQWTASQIQTLKETGHFFNPVDRLDRFSVSIEKLNEWNQSQTACDKHQVSPFGGINKLPHPAAITVDQLQKKITEKIQKDVNNQKTIIDNAVVCTAKKPPTGCEKFISILMPELQDRLKTMRVLKSLADQSDNIQHDKPFTDNLYQNFYPSLWGKTKQIELSPLSEDEIKTRNELAQTISPEAARTAYYSLISTTRTLLFFDKEVTKENMHQAFKNLQSQNQFDQLELLKNPQQELLLMADYVKEAITELPEAQKGDACLVVSEIYRNLEIQYEKFPLYLAMVSGMASLSGPGVTIMGKKILEGQLKKMTLAGAATLGSISIKNFQAYQNGVSFCSTQAVSNEMLKSKVCNFEKLEQIYDEAQWGAIASSTLMVGSVALSLLRMTKGLHP